ncbi:MAG: AraC family transcriptional regulator, partial [Peptococcaceae bacterium]|nr:AraC family transcriptional regulator [Peptococcaceae bacterium]
MEDKQKNIIESFEKLFDQEELLAKVIEYFPYPIQVYAPDGTSVLVNKAMLAEYNISRPEMIVGR